MKRLIPAVCIAFAFAVSVAAQTPASQPTDPQSSSPSQSKSMSSDKTVTLSGCVREGDTPNTYVLANVDPSSIKASGSSSSYGSPSSSTPSSSASSTGTSGAASSADKVKVQLSAASNVNLKDHIGHQVSVTGTLAPAGAMSSGATGTAGSPSSSAPGSASDQPKHKLNVSSVAMVSSSCSM